MFSNIEIYLGVGLCAGFLAGLLGMGGGTIIVPALIFLFTRLGVEGEQVIALAMGTSLAAMTLTSAANARAHHRTGSVDWSIVKKAAPWAASGVFLGALGAGSLPKIMLIATVVVLELYVATIMLFGRAPLAAAHAALGPSGQIEAPLITPFCSLLGALAGLAGSGGGVLLVPFLTSAGIPLRRAIGVSAALGFPVGLAGALGYALAGVHHPAGALAEYCVGFIYLPAFFGIVAGSILTVGWGADAARHIDAPTLKKVFAVLLYVVALKMLLGQFPL